MITFFKSLPIRKIKPLAFGLFFFILTFSASDFSTFPPFHLSIPLAHASYAGSLPTLLNNGLVGYWTMDGKNLLNNVADSSVNGNTGYLKGFTSTSSAVVAGKVGQALKFTRSSSQYIRTSDISLTGAMTICAWVNPSSIINGDNIIVAKMDTGYANEQYDLDISAINTGGYAFMWESSSNANYVHSHTPDYTAQVGVWQHVCATRDASNNPLIYVNGVSQNLTITTAGSNVPPTISANTQIGKAGDDTNSYFDGNIDDVRIYNRALSASEISELYVLGSVHYVTSQANPLYDNDVLNGLVGRWNFDEGSGTTANDTSGNGDNGTLSGSTLPTWVNGQIGGHALSFNGASSYVSIASNPISSFASANSGCAWFYTNDYAYNAGYDVVFSFYADTNNSVVLYTSPSSGSISLGYRVGGSNIGYNTDNIVNNTWTHFCYTYDGATFNYYINGAAAGLGYSTSNTAQANTIGQLGAGEGYWYGKIDDVRVYNRVLSQEEVTRIYNSTGPIGLNTGLNKGLVGYWTFDGKNMIKNVVDSSGSGNTGYLQGFTSTSSAVVAGKVGQALNFSGSSQTVKILAKVPLQGNALTVSFWMKAGTLSTPEDVFTKNNASGPDSCATDCDFSVVINKAGGGSGSLDLYIGSPISRDNFTSSSFISNTSNWYYVTIVRNGDSVLFYRNGTLVTTDTGNGTTNFANTNYGSDVGGDSFGYFNGSLDDIRVYNRALSATEVKQLYGLGFVQKDVSSAVNASTCISGPSCGLVGYWTFDGKDTTWLNSTDGTEVDKSGNSNTIDFYVTNQSTAPVAGKIGQALKFNSAAGDSANVANFSTNTKILTDCFWLKWNTFANDDALAMEYSTNYNTTNDSFVIDPDSSSPSGKFEVSIQSGGFKYRSESFTRPSAAVWHHYCIVFDNSTLAGNIIAYVDGVSQSMSVDTNTKNGNGTFAGLPLFFMSRDGTSLYGGGSIDDVRIYNRALSATEVAQLYGMGK